MGKLLWRLDQAVRVVALHLKRRWEEVTLFPKLAEWISNNRCELCTTRLALCNLVCCLGCSRQQALPEILLQTGALRKWLR
jgi:hypothetical protein